MKFFAFCLLLGSSNAFAPISSSTKQNQNTRLNVLTDQEIFEYNTGAYGVANGNGYGYRRGGSLYYPEQDYGRVGSSEYRNSPYETKVEGGSRRTFNTAYMASNSVELQTDGRPLQAKVEVWEGPDNTPAKMKLYSEDGMMRPWMAGFANTQARGVQASSSTTMTVDNEAAGEFPLYANVGDGMRYMGSSRRRALTVDGNGAQKSFPIGPGPHVVEIWSEGFPFYSDVEIWEGPNNIKQKAEVYSDNGLDRPWYAIIDNDNYDSTSQNSGVTIQVRNVGPLEYPLRVSVEPLGGGYYGGGYGYGGY